MIMHHNARKATGCLYQPALPLLRAAIPGPSVAAEAQAGMAPAAICLPPSSRLSQTLTEGVSSKLPWETLHPDSHGRRLIQIVTESVSSKLPRERLHPDSHARRLIQNSQKTFCTEGKWLAWLYQPAVALLRAGMPSR